MTQEGPAGENKAAFLDSFRAMGRGNSTFFYIGFSNTGKLKLPENSQEKPENKDTPEKAKLRKAEILTMHGVIT